MREILSAILSAGELPFLNVLKRFGKESGGVLVSCEGYTLAIDFPIRTNTVALLRRLDAGGAGRRRPRLSGQGCLSSKAATFAPCIRRSSGWLAIKAKYDPEGVFTSDLGRRGGLGAASLTPR